MQNSPDKCVEKNYLKTDIITYIPLVLLVSIVEIQKKKTPLKIGEGWVSS